MVANMKERHKSGELALTLQRLLPFRVVLLMPEIVIGLAKTIEHIAPTTMMPVANPKGNLASLVELPPFGGHSIIGYVMPMRRCSHAPHQAGLSAGIQS